MSVLRFQPTTTPDRCLPDSRGQDFRFRKPGGVKARVRMPRRTQISDQLLTVLKMDSPCFAHTVGSGVILIHCDQGHYRQQSWAKGAEMIRHGKATFRPESHIAATPPLVPEIADAAEVDSHLSRACGSPAIVPRRNKSVTSRCTSEKHRGGFRQRGVSG